MSVQLGLEFPTTGGQLLKWDFFPAGDHSPLVVCIHGGGWISGDPSMMHDVAISLNQSGFAAACPQYRLAPLDPFPAAIDDVRHFVKHVKSNSTDLGVDPNAIASLGNSAGGHLATLLGLGSDDDSKVAAVVDICGISDLTAPDDQHYPISHGFLEQFMGEPYYLNEVKWRLASPIFQVDAKSSPFLIIHGECDDVVPIAQSEALAGKLFANNVPVEFHRIPNEGHAFTFDGWTKIEGLFLDFLNRQLRHESLV